MRKVKVGGVDVMINASPYSVVAYERAFPERDAEGHRLYDINDDVNTLLSARTGNLTVLPVGALLRLLYVYEASVPEAPFMPDFDAWVRELPAGALDHVEFAKGDGWVTGLLHESIHCFFPSFAQEDVVAGEGTEEEAEPAS